MQRRVRLSRNDCATRIEAVNDELAARLRRLGLSRGARDLHPAPNRAEEAPGVRRRQRQLSLEQLLPGGRLLESETGACFVVDHVYPAGHVHGDERLASLLEFEPASAATFAHEPRLAGLEFRDFLFLDTETTGLAGAGTLAFMVGVGFFERRTDTGDTCGDQEIFVVRQYFLRDHADEPAMLLELARLVAERAGLITFNGRTFDLPLLDGRYLVNRLPGNLRDAPHLDLLPLARRLWRARLGSCALAALEGNLLGLERSQEDVPGYLIPELYREYLVSGDAEPLSRVFYHNRIDMLSMVTLSSRTMALLSGRAAGPQPLDMLSLARWQMDLGLHDEAERTFRQAMDGDLELTEYQLALAYLGQLYKRRDRRADALMTWQQLAATSTDTVDAHVELAKHFEWHDGDLTLALDWTEKALALVDLWRDSPYKDSAREALRHRADRLGRKLGG